MHALEDNDRAAVLLRYFENKSLREVGACLGVSDDAAQKRVRRAVEQLREFLAKRGVPVGAGGLTVAVSAHAVQAAPASLTFTICKAAALTGTTLATPTAATAAKAISMTTIQKALLTATVVMAGAGVYEAHQASQLRKQLLALQQQQGPVAARIQQLERERNDALRRLARLAAQAPPRLPAPQIQTGGPPPQDLQSTNLYERFTGSEVKLNREQVEPYLAANGRSAGSLLAAFRTTGDSPC